MRRPRVPWRPADWGGVPRSRGNKRAEDLVFRAFSVGEEHLGEPFAFGQGDQRGEIVLWRGADFQPGRWKNPQFFWENQGDVGIMNVEIKINRDARKFIMFQINQRKDTSKGKGRRAHLVPARAAGEDRKESHQTNCCEEVSVCMIPWSGQPRCCPN